MRRYNDYKDSGVAWMGKIPSHWDCMKTKWLLHERTEKSVDGEGEPLSMCQKYGLIPTSQMDMIPNGATSYIGAKKTYVGDLVLNKLKAHLGVFALSAYNGLVSPDYAVYQGTKRTHLEYLLYLFKTPLYISEFIKKTTGVAIGFNRLYTDDLFSISAHYPPIEEQKVIVDYLKVKISKIDQYVAQRERERELLESLKQSEIANIVTKGLNPNVPMKDSGIPWIGMIPEHWEVKRLAISFDENREYNSTLERTNAFQFNYGSLVLKNRDYKESEDAPVYAKYTLINPNDIVINGLNLNYDFVSQRVALVKEGGIITSAYICIRPRKQVYSNYYCYLFKAMDSMKLFHGMGTGIRLTLSFEELKKQYIPIPPLSEQQAIVEYIDAKLSKIDQYMADLQAEIDYLKEFKQRLISDAVTGQICVAEPQKGNAQ